MLSLTRHSMLQIIALIFFVFVGAVNAKWNDAHPNLTVTQKDIATILIQIDQVPRAQEALKQLIKKVDAIMTQPIDVPLPKDAGGGYTHEQHKRNYKSLYESSLLFQVTKDSRYLAYATRMLLSYTELYPSLGKHPKHKEQTPGKLFWQSLNEAMWLVYTIQAYDMIVSSLNHEDRLTIENNLKTV